MSSPTEPVQPTPEHNSANSPTPYGTPPVANPPYYPPPTAYNPNVVPAPPPYQQPQAPQAYQQPQYGNPAQPAYSGSPYSVHPPQYQSPQYPQGGYPPNGYNGYGQPKKKSKVGLFVLIGVALFTVVCVLIGVVFTNVMNAFTSAPYQPNTSQGGEEFTPPELDFDGDDTGGTSDHTSGSTHASLEEDWKSGEYWKEAPASMEQPDAFTDEIPDVNVWLQQLEGVDPEVRVVVTSDPEYNCGAEGGVSEGGFGGCYSRSYGKVLFLWWGTEATDNEKRFMALHEYSHYLQNWNYFDAVQTAVVEDVASSDEFVTMMEADATCRVYDGWGYSEYRYIDRTISAPCGDTQWYDGWFEDQITNTFGLVIQDY